ncbi:hypothetical protein QBC43DRAFT_294248 [Cladorrhinum sp. PSN259]|nr:hypothetical protein QBC43DRAFT_294248 [Cladorrhinum sp. PSN259]
MDAVTSQILAGENDGFFSSTTSITTATGLSVVSIMMAMTVTEQLRQSVKALNLALQLLNIPVARHH